MARRKGSDMKRYTEKIDGLWTVLCEYGDLPCPVVTQDVIDLLAAYEDTGLEPEEVAKIREDVENGYMKSTARRYGISVARLRELAQADREGRCVVIRPNSATDDNYKIICRKINAEDIHLGKVRNVHEKHK